MKKLFPRSCRRSHCLRRTPRVIRSPTCRPSKPVRAMGTAHENSTRSRSSSTPQPRLSRTSIRHLCRMTGIPFQCQSFAADAGKTVTRAARRREIPTISSRPRSTSISTQSPLSGWPSDWVSTPHGSSMNWGDNWSGAHLVQEINLTAFTSSPPFRIARSATVFRSVQVLDSRGAISTCRGRCSPHDAPRTYLRHDRPGHRQGPGGNRTARKRDCGPCPTAHRKRLTNSNCNRHRAPSRRSKAPKAISTAPMNRSLVSAKLQGDSDVAVGVNAGFLGTSPTNGRSA